MRRVLLVANPSASAFTGALHREVVGTLSGPFEVVAEWPGSAAETEMAARTAAAERFDAVVAMGGDGVVHHVANGLVGTTTALGIVPAGTTNVLARILGMPHRPRSSARALIDAKPFWVPMAHVATESPTGARSVFATFSVGVGFDADVVAAAERRPHSKLHFGSLHYARTAAFTLLGRYRNRRPNLRVEARGRRVDAVTVLTQIHSPYTYFGRVPLKVTPHHVDGLAALVIERLPATKAAAIVARALTGRPLDNTAGVHLWTEFEKLVIEAEPASLYQADGELLGRTTALEVTPAPYALRVLVPQPPGKDIAAALG